MESTLQISIRSVYGRDTIYPMNEQAKRLADMVGTRTLTQQTIRQAIAMGFRVEYIDGYRAAYGSRELVA